MQETISQEEHTHQFVREQGCRGHIEYGLIFHHYVCRCGAAATKHWLRGGEEADAPPEPGPRP